MKTTSYRRCTIRSHLRTKCNVNVTAVAKIVVEICVLLYWELSQYAMQCYAFVVFNVRTYRRASQYCKQK